MKLVRGIVREEKIHAIVEELTRIGAPGATVTHVTGQGEKMRTATYRGVKYPALLPMCAIEVNVDDNCADEIARTIVDTAHTGQKGDGHVFIIQMEEAYAVRTRWRNVA